MNRDLQAATALAHAIRSGEEDAYAVAADALEEAGAPTDKLRDGMDHLRVIVLVGRSRAANERSALLRSICHLSEEP